MRRILSYFGGLFFLLLSLLPTDRVIPARFVTETVAPPVQSYDGHPARPDCSSSQEMEALN